LGVILNPTCCGIPVCDKIFVNWVGSVLNLINLTPDASGGITYGVVYATILGNPVSITPLWSPPPVGISETQIQVSDGTYTVLFPTSGDPLASSFIMETGFIIECADGTTKLIETTIEFVVPQ
jgi:hypothetical protein